VPATIANLGPGFDALGMAVDLYDRFRVAVADRAAVSFTGESAAELYRISLPLVLRAAEAVVRRAGRDAAFAIEVHLTIPVARGLGSSAASIVGGLVAANHLLGTLWTAARCWRWRRNWRATRTTWPRLCWAGWSW